ncbi:hypothetical protein FQR65_LT13609 [Abscondita terminalis]|nr:hypothetical protein FQR65_LT13609 [Abscondita terminalis]
MNTSTEPYLELSDHPVRFEAVNQVTNVFFDDSNKQVFAVRSGGTMGVVVKGPTEDIPPINFRMEDRGPVISIKFSLDQSILAVQRTTSSVEFFIFNGNTIEGEFSQSCKKNTALLGFVWTQNNEVALLTDHGIELYNVISEKKILKHSKTTSAVIQWFVWCPKNKIALLASSHGSQLQPVVFKPGTVSKLSKVETEPGRMTLERDVTLATLYGIPAVLILRHQSGPQTAEVHVHTLNGPGQAPVKSHVLRLGLSGRFAINVVDDLILVHHQASRTSQVFDITLLSESDGTVNYHKSVAPAKSLKPTSLPVPGLVEPTTRVCDLYSPNWVVFQPNIVIDAKLGCLWHIKLSLNTLCAQIPDLSVCTQLALKRTKGKEVLLQIVLEHIQLPKPLLYKLQESFDHINSVYRVWADAQILMQTASPVSAPPPSKPSVPPRVLITQSDMYHYIFQKLMMNDDYLQNLEWALISYMTSLSEYCIPVEFSLNELLIKILVQRSKFTALVQLLQYGIVADSKLLACLLLSLGNLHPSASQLAMDMLIRLGATEEIQEVLIDQGQLLSAFKLSQDGVNPRKFLQAAEKSGDPTLFHSILYCFRTNHQYDNAFLKDERVQSYIQHYRMLFPEIPTADK